MIWMSILGVFAFILWIFYWRTWKFQERKVSSARFFEDNDAKSSKYVWYPFKILLSRSFWFQLAVLAGLGAAFFTADWNVPRDVEETLGIMVLVDTSASMTADNGTGNRMDAVREAGAELVSQLEEISSRYDSVSFCIRVQYFDMELRPYPNAVTLGDIPAILANVEPRLLGTNINLIQALAFSDESLDANCNISHLVVLTDSPAPDWIANSPEDLRIIWQDLGEAVDNVGLTRINRTGFAAFDTNGNIRVEFASYGIPPPQTILTLVREDGSVSGSITHTWTEEGTAAVIFPDVQGGTYSLSIDNGGGYIHDDSARFFVEDRQSLRVSWRLQESLFVPLESLGMSLDEQDPQLAVLPLEAINEAHNYPASLMVGENLYMRRESPRQITFFIEDSPLLEDLNFDVAESLHIEGRSINLEAALMDDAGELWIGFYENPRLVYIPGLPQNTQTNPELDAFSQTVFFNALRWLINAEAGELYSLTSPSDVIPHDTVTSLHLGEGSTAAPSASIGTIEDIEPRSANPPDNPFWVYVLPIVGILLVWERYGSLRGGSGWE